MCNYIIALLFVFAGAVAWAADYLPTSFYRYSTTRTVQRHTITTGTKEISITPTVASFFNYTGNTATGATRIPAQPMAANTRYSFQVPQDSNVRRLAFMVTTTAVSPVLSTPGHFHIVESR
jgi:hypothetical protein